MKHVTILMPLLATALFFGYNLRAQTHEAQAERQRKHDVYKAAINRVLREDSAISAVSGNNYTTIAAAMRRVNLSQCPTDFAADYVKHIHAWEDGAKIQEALTKLRSGQNVSRVIIEGALQKLIGTDDNDNALKNAADLEKQLIAAKERTDKEIRRTFDMVELVAIQYDATLTKR